MIGAELAAWNASKLAELGGDALEVAQMFLQRFPEAKITSAARDYKDQARAMAQNACAQRDKANAADPDKYTWIAETYWPSIAARSLQKWFVEHPTASEPDCVDAFIGIMRALPPADLRALSKHIVVRDCGEACVDDRAEAFDVAVPESSLRWDMYCAVLREEAARRGGRFLAKEGNEVRGHWQAGDKR